MPSFHWYWRLVPVAATVSVTLLPGACVVVATGWVVIAGATTAPPELELLEDEELLELDEDELLEELELELDELELPVPELVPPEELEDELPEPLELLDELEDDDELDAPDELLDE